MRCKIANEVRAMGKMYGVRFDLWVAGKLEPQLVLFEGEDPPAEQVIAGCVRDRVKGAGGPLFGRDAENPDVPVVYRSGVASDQELWGRDPGFGALCQEVRVAPRGGGDERGAQASGPGGEAGT
jgi:hypothetical protein